MRASPFHTLSIGGSTLGYAHVQLLSAECISVRCAISCYSAVLRSMRLQLLELLEISWNFVDTLGENYNYSSVILYTHAPGNCQSKL